MSVSESRGGAQPRFLCRPFADSFSPRDAENIDLVLRRGALLPIEIRVDDGQHFFWLGEQVRSEKFRDSR